MNSKKTHIVIIGNGAAGISAAESIAEINHSEVSPSEITLISTEPGAVYYRPMLSEYLSEESLPKRFYLHSIDWYTENKIRLLQETKVSSIDRESKTLTLSDDTSLIYDKLILATGSYNFVPPMPGAALKNVKNLRTLEDAEEIRSIIKAGKKAVVIGGGLLGLELGWQLLQKGISVTVVEMMERLLPRQLDTEASALFLEKVLDTGMNILTGVGTEAILGEEEVSGVKLSNGETIPADYVFISIGVRADVGLAKACGLNLNRGILVDGRMCTSDPSIFAAGDCAEFDGVNYAIWPEATAQGKVAGINATGGNALYEQTIPFNIYHGMNLRLFSIGDAGSLGDSEYEIHRHRDGDNFEKIFAKNNQVVGGVLMGNISRSAKLKKALQSRLSLSEYLTL